MKVAVIGYGRWGPNQARNFGMLADLVAIADTDPARLQAAAEKHPGVVTCPDYGRAIDESDAVIVATPVHTHSEIVQYALEHGRHVLCEKPLCLTAQEARELHGVARYRQRVLMTGYTYLYNARAQWIQNVDFGQIYAIQTDTVNLGPVRNDVGVTADLATHHIALLQQWIGTPHVVSATGSRCLGGEYEDVAAVSLIYPGGVHASIYVSWLAPRKSRLFRVTGEKRTVEWDDANTNMPICVYEGGARPREHYDTEAEFMHLSAWTGSRVLPGVPHIEPLRVQAEHFLQVIEQGTHHFDVFDEAVCATLEAALHSIDAYGEPTTVKVRRS